MDSREQFKATIYEHYKNVVSNEFPEQLLNEVVTKLTDVFYEQYSRFKKQYPKSSKRYSSFLVKDLDHPQAFECVIKSLKPNVKTDYKKYAGELMKMSETEVTNFEQRQKDFYSMF
jgi:hypothetical protein